MKTFSDALHELKLALVLHVLFVPLEERQLAIEALQGLLGQRVAKEVLQRVREIEDDAVRASVRFRTQ